MCARAAVGYHAAVGYRAVRDTVPGGIPCRAGYPCRVGYRAAVAYRAAVWYRAAWDTAVLTPSALTITVRTLISTIGVLTILIRGNDKHNKGC